jgi:hypothetical protein
MAPFSWIPAGTYRTLVTVTHVGATGSVASPAVTIP